MFSLKAGEGEYLSEFYVLCTTFRDFQVAFEGKASKIVQSEKTFAIMTSNNDLRVHLKILNHIKGIYLEKQIDILKKIASIPELSKEKKLV